MTYLALSFGCYYDLITSAIMNNNTQMLSYKNKNFSGSRESITLCAIYSRSEGTLSDSESSIFKLFFAKILHKEKMGRQ